MRKLLLGAAITAMLLIPAASIAAPSAKPTTTTGATTTTQPPAQTSVRSIRYEVLNVTPGATYSAGFSCDAGEVAFSPAVMQFIGTTEQQRLAGLKWAANDTPATGGGWTGAAPRGYTFFAEAGGVEGDTLRFFITCVKFA